MLRGMIFVDHMNFDIALQSYYKTLGKMTVKLDYKKLFRNLVKRVENVDLVKSSIYVPKPDDFLMSDARLKNYYNWVTGLSNIPFTDVIEGNYIARQVDPNVSMDINVKNTYYKVEKGTDVNLAVDVINKAFHNSYDVAFVLSGDTDYLKVYEVLRSLGKLTVVVVVEGQSVYRIKPYVDSTITLDEAFFNTCLRTIKTTNNVNATSAVIGSLSNGVTSNTNILSEDS